MTDDRKLREHLDDPAAFEAALGSFVAGPLADETATRVLDGARRRAAVPLTLRTRCRSWWERLVASPRLIPALALSLLLANLGLDASANRFARPNRRQLSASETAAFTSSDLGLNSSWVDARTRLALAARKPGTEGFHRPRVSFDAIND